MNPRHLKVTWTVQLVRTQSCELSDSCELLCVMDWIFCNEKCTMKLKSLLPPLPTISFTQPQLQDELEPPALSKAV